MYRLNATQQQQPQEPQASTTKQKRSSIPSHILLQQQLATSAGASSSATPTSNSHAALTLHVASSNGGAAAAPAIPSATITIAVEDKLRPTSKTIKIEPMPDIALNTVAGGACASAAGAAPTSNKTPSTAASTSAAAAAANGHLVQIPNKRPRLDAAEDWMSTPSPGSVPSSAPPLSPSPGSQNHSYNGYASPMSAGSYDPYSPNGKTG
ncbi:hypothetical protein KR032_012453, partial [Drosophila birchii]